MRDIDKNPYSEDEARVAQFFFDAGLGGGDDPIGFIIASHQVLAAERNDLRKVVADAIETLESMDLHDDNPLYERLRAALEGRR